MKNPKIALYEFQNKKILKQYAKRIDILKATETSPNSRSRVNSDKSQNNQQQKSQFDTVIIQEKYQNLKGINNKRLKNISLWSTTAEGLTRQKSPTYKFSEAKRFSSIQERSTQNDYIIDLKYHSKLSNHSVSFAKSQRTDHFLQKYNQQSPSPATYNKMRYLDNSNYKRDIINQKIRLPMLNQIDYYDQKHNTTSNNNNRKTNTSQSCRFDELKGRTFTKFNNYSKQYKPHAKNMLYQPEFSLQNPGVGNYKIQKKIGSNKPSYTMRQTLTRFIDLVKDTPGKGPAAYIPMKSQTHRNHSINEKYTFAQSKRTYLQNPQSYSPGPMKYTIQRYLQVKQQYI